MSLRDAIAGLKEGQAEAAQPNQEKAPPRTPKKERGARPKPVTVKKAVPGVAKSTNPEYVQLKVYVHGDRRRQASHKWENEGGRDMSDLIEKLLDQYLRT